MSPTSHLSTFLCRIKGDFWGQNGNIPKKTKKYPSIKNVCMINRSTKLSPKRTSHVSPANVTPCVDSGETFGDALKEEGEAEFDPRNLFSHNLSIH